MAFEDIEFPVYRKYKNGKSFFKILSPVEFEEIQLIGSKKISNRVQATQLPERNHIFDLVYDKTIAEEISASDFEAFRANSL